MLRVAQSWDRLVSKGSVGGDVDLAEGIAQGNAFAGLIGKIPLNPGFTGGLVSVESAGKPSSFEGLTLRVVGPDARALMALKKDWDRWLVKASRRTARGKASPDTSVTNRSSIVLLAENGSKSMLLTGDSRWDEVLGGLKTAGARASPTAASCPT